MTHYTSTHFILGPLHVASNASELEECSSPWMLRTCTCRSSISGSDLLKFVGTLLVVGFEKRGNFTHE